MPSEDPAARRARNLEALGRLLTAAPGSPEVLELVAEDCIGEFPYAFGAYPRRLEGRHRLAAFFGATEVVFESFAIEDLTLHETLDPDTFLAEFSGVGRLRGGGDYANPYVWSFRFSEGRLARFREYYNPDCQRPLRLDERFAAALAMDSGARLSR